MADALIECIREERRTVIRCLWSKDLKTSDFNGKVMVR
jgi:hypothetical protein